MLTLAFRKRRAAGLLIAAELVVLLLWTVVVTGAYLNFDPTMVPAGREFLAAIQNHHSWNWMRVCGSCALWFGSVNGGFPLGADPVASTFHPLVAFTTLGWGVLTGAKLTLVASFFLAGLGQWWLARVLRLGRAARLWSACMGVAAGVPPGMVERSVIHGVTISSAPPGREYAGISHPGRRRTVCSANGRGGHLR